MLIIPPHMHVFSPLCFVYNKYSTFSDPLLVQCTIPVLNELPNFYMVVIFCVLTLYSRWYKGCFVEVKWPLNYGVCQHSWFSLEGS